MAVKKTKTGAAKAEAGGGGAKKPSAKANANAAALNTLIHNIGLILDDFMNAAQIFNNLSPKERKRLFGAGVRNYGFIEKVRDIATDNPSFLPPNFDVQEFSDGLREFDQIRQFYLLAEKVQTLASDSMLLKSNALYLEALRVYNTLREQSRSRVPGAKDLFTALETFFKRRRASDRPPTEAQELRKARSLIKGRTDGEMVIKNVRAKKSGGVHEVIEDVRTDSVTG